MFIGADVLIGAVKCVIQYVIILKQKLLKHFQGVLICVLPILLQFYKNTNKVKDLDRCLMDESFAQVVSR